MRATPVVTVHVAQSLDGRLALRGRATPLSSPEGRTSAHEARARHDAVLVGIDTVRTDDPRLTVRHAAGPDPLRVILASQLDVPLAAHVFARPGTLVIGARGRATEASQAALVARGVEVTLVSAAPDGRVSIEATLAALGARGIRKLLVEGGAKVITSFFRAKCVDHIEVEISMLVLGAPATATLGGLDVHALEHAPTFTNVTVDRLGANVLVRGDVVS